jgi:hypothetical protein
MWPNEPAVASVLIVRGRGVDAQVTALDAIKTRKTKPQVMNGTEWIVSVGAICGLVLALIYSTAYLDPSVDHRLAKHGYPSGTAQQILSERDKAKHPDRMRRYMETYRASARGSNSVRTDA